MTVADIISFHEFSRAGLSDFFHMLHYTFGTAGIERLKHSVVLRRKFVKNKDLKILVLHNPYTNYYILTTIPYHHHQIGDVESSALRYNLAADFPEEIIRVVIS